MTRWCSKTDLPAAASRHSSCSPALCRAHRGSPRIRTPKPITCQTRRDDSHHRQPVATRSLKLCPSLVNLCPELPPEPTHPKGALEEQPCLVPGAASPAQGRCSSAVRALPGGSRAAPSHTHSLGCRNLPCHSDTHRFFQLRKHHRVFIWQRAHAAARTPTAAPGRQLSRSGWGARHAPAPGWAARAPPGLLAPRL